MSLNNGVHFSYQNKAVYNISFRYRDVISRGYKETRSSEKVDTMVVQMQSLGVCDSWVSNQFSCRPAIQHAGIYLDSHHVLDTTLVGLCLPLVSRMYLLTYFFKNIDQQ